MHSDFYDWQWQLRNSIRSVIELEKIVSLTPSEKRGIEILNNSSGLPLRITPYFLSLINKDNPNDPLRRQIVPHEDELVDARDDRRDPLGEEDHEVVPHLVHRYPDRVLLLITDRCASYCRFCTRKRWVGQGPTPKSEHLQQALDYVREHQAIREVIISGGDALMLDDTKLDKLLSDIRQIKHVEIIRLATRMMAFAPMRVTKNLVEVLKKHQPVYVMAHFNHVNELSPQASQAITDLVDAGVPVLNQTVLLKGVNDNAESLSELFRALTRLRARPYDLHQCDVVKGASQFRVPLERALQIMKQLRGHISGLCVPHFIVDIPGGFGKVSITPESIVKRDDTHVYLQGFDGEVAPYPLD